MKSILSSKISPLINYSPFSNLVLKPDQNYVFPLWLKVPFLVFLTFLFLRAFFIPWFGDLFQIRSNSSTAYTNFFHIYQYFFFFVILVTILYLNFFLNKTNYVLRIFFPLIAYVLVNIILDFVMFFLPSSFDFAWFFLYPDDFPHPKSESRILFKNLFLDPLITLTAVIGFFWVEKVQFKRIYRLFRNRPLTVIFYALTVMFIMLLRAKPEYLTQALDNSSGKISDNEGYHRFYLKNTTQFGKIFYIVSLVVIFPFWEELVFRFALQKIFATQKSQGFLIFVVFSSFMFALPHISPSEIGTPTGFFDFFQRLFYGTTGTNFTYWYMAYILGLLYLFSGYNLFFVIIVHVINNGVVTL